ncbi:MAG: hypothetical protein LBQ95_08700 [Lachnospiraceae bacterium]|nr:hypothetical protein [Lachnospiraceae bacterium]
MPWLNSTVLVAVVTVFGGALVKLISDTVKNGKTQKELLRVTKEKAAHDAIIEKLRAEREAAQDARSEAYDSYDEASKFLVGATAKSYLSGNDKKGLKEGIEQLEEAKKKFKDANREYYRTLAEITERLTQTIK